MTYNKIDIISHSPLLEERLEPFRQVIGDDFAGYRGHLYRVLTYAIHFLGGDETFRAEIETALAYHDIAVWTHNSLDYLQPSADMCMADNVQNNWGYDPKLLEDIILQHHKITKFRGPNENVVNAVRKGDWVDAYQGMLRKGLSKAQVNAVAEAIPAEGFYESLARLNKELKGYRNLHKVLKF